MAPGDNLLTHLVLLMLVADRRALREPAARLPDLQPALDERARDVQWAPVVGPTDDRAVGDVVALGEHPRRRAARAVRPEVVRARLRVAQPVLELPSERLFL